MKYTNKEIGRCLTEVKLVNFEQVATECVLFFTVPQVRNVDGFTFKRLEELNIRMTSDMPKCGHGQKLYGVQSDKSIVKLMEIVDSSD